jgi:hypothetical protein
MPPKIKIEFCTSCGSQDIKVTGNTYYCPDCDINYKVTTQGTKVVDTNPLGKEKARVDQLEQDVAELKGNKEPGAEPAEKGIATEAGDKAESRAAGGEDDEDDPEQQGFITIED